ncbi:helix-turn-helix domain-containing protein [Vibrio parahaemolyticus]|nr:helix-turn-helix domain-containing protein [Vibrio parahaemolyticus]
MLISNDGDSRTQIAKFLKVSRTSVNKWVQSFLEERQEKPSIGRAPLFYLFPARPHGLFIDNFQLKHPKQYQQTQEDLKKSKSKRSLRSQNI